MQLDLDENFVPANAMSETVLSFQHITSILTLTDELGLDREWVEIPLSPERPGVVRRLPNGKLEIVVDADVPFAQWLTTLPDSIRALDAETGTTSA